MNRFARVRSTLTIGAALLCAAPAYGAEGPHNWMREYVELRQQALLDRILGVEDAAELRSRAGTRIINGTTAAPGSNPFQVGLLYKAEPDNFFAQYCGGSLVRPNVVVTAAHCSDFVTANQVQVLTGARRLDGSGTRRNVQRIIVHPAWDPATSNNDVAVWILTTSASGIPLATLANTDPPTGTNLLATGWGDTTDAEATTDFPIELRQVNVPLVSRANCNDANSYNGAITTKMICAGFNAGGKDTCQGDSGGPLTRKQNNSFKVLTGVTSFGSGCAEPDFFGVYTRVSQFRNWIINQYP
jgi:trypsin